MLVIGSTALQLLGYDVKPKDLDLVATHEEAQEFIKRTKPKVAYPLSADTLFLRYEDGQICEIEIAWPDSKAERLLILVERRENDEWGGSAEIRGWRCDYPTLDLLYLLKLSHRYKKDSPHFLKTMRDIQWMRSQGATIWPEWEHFLKEREKLTYTNSLPKLNVDKSTFFDAEATGVKYTYSHDSIHEAIAIDEVPAYTRYSIEGEEVLCSREKFFQQPYRVQLLGVVEESCVLALERSLIPFPGAKTPDEAFLFALMKVCTSITSGFFREFAYENYDAVVSMYATLQDTNMCYTERFRKGLETGVVLPFNQGAMK